jgi:5-methylcytosine-specific restriction protein A
MTLTRRQQLRSRTGLKPGKALVAGNALVRKVGLAQVGRRRQEASEAAGKPVRPVFPGRSSPTGPDRLTVEAVLERADWACERCSNGLGPVRGRDWHVHHRRPRAAGGSSAADTNSPPNLGILCPVCHGEVESRRAEAQRDGWLVPQGANPARVAVLIRRGSRWVYLTANARYSLHPPNQDNREWN